MKLTSASAERNVAPILAVLLQKLAHATALLEIASGTGQHAAALAQALPVLRVQPTEYAGGAGSPEATAHDDLEPLFASIREWGAPFSPRVLPPIALDASAAAWPVDEERYDAIFASNLLHISPESVCAGLFAGAGRVLVPGGALLVYGPFMLNGAHTAPSNVAFDERLRSQNSEWGVRCVNELADLAASHGINLVERIDMPANNMILHFCKARSEDT